jgi:dolichol-phosphate mannosyltransferase
MEGPEISVVVPVYGSPESLMELSTRLADSLEIITSTFEVILVNDGSPDNSWDIITKIAASDNRFIGIRLSRNFGQHPAISAGLQKSRGNWVVVMDCDLQDRPEEIPNLYRKALEGFEQVVAVRRNRQDSFLKRLSSKLFMKVLTYLSGQEGNHQVGNFGIYNRSVITAINSMPEQIRTFTLLSRWVGFTRAELEVQHMPRQHGQTSYSFRQLLSLGLTSVISYSDKPLKMTISFGFCISITSILWATYLVIRNILWGVSIVGWTSLIVAISFMTGVLMATIGIVALYIGRIFEETKTRPIYIVAESTTMELD